MIFFLVFLFFVNIFLAYIAIESYKQKKRTERIIEKCERLTSKKQYATKVHKNIKL